MSAKEDAKRVVKELIDNSDKVHWINAFGKKDVLPNPRFQIIHKQHAVFMDAEIRGGIKNSVNGIFNLLAKIHMWMPRMGVNLDPDLMVKGSITHQLIMAIIIDPYGAMNKTTFTQLLKVIPIGTLSKLLYFLHPSLYPILDKNVIYALKEMGVDYGPFSSYNNFVCYIHLFQEINQIYSSDRMRSLLFSMEVSKECGNLTTVRVVEFLLYAKHAAQT